MSILMYRNAFNFALYGVHFCSPLLSRTCFVPLCSMYSKYCWLTKNRQRDLILNSTNSTHIYTDEILKIHLKKKCATFMMTMVIQSLYRSIVLMQFSLSFRMNEISCICSRSIEAERKSWWCLHTPNDTQKYQNKQKHLPIIKCQWNERKRKKWSNRPMYSDSKGSTIQLIKKLDDQNNRWRACFKRKKK